MADFATAEEFEQHLATNRGLTLEELRAYLRDELHSRPVPCDKGADCGYGWQCRGWWLVPIEDENGG